MDEITSRILDIEGHDGDPSLVESGADAMLEALRGDCFIQFFTEEGENLRVELQHRKGCWVFIPDDKEE